MLHIEPASQQIYRHQVLANNNGSRITLTDKGKQLLLNCIRRNYLVEHPAFYPCVAGNSTGHPVPSKVALKENLSGMI